MSMQNTLELPCQTCSNWIEIGQEIKLKNYFNSRMRKKYITSLLFRINQMKWRNNILSFLSSLNVYLITPETHRTVGCMICATHRTFHVRRIARFMCDLSHILQRSPQWLIFDTIDFFMSNEPKFIFFISKMINCWFEKMNCIKILNPNIKNLTVWETPYS